MANFDGTTLADIYNSGASADVLNGYAGDDSLSGGAGNDVIYGEGTGTPTPITVGSQTSDMQINTTIAGNQLGVSMVALAGGGFMATWISTAVGDNAGGQVMGQLYDANNQAFGNEFAIGTATVDSDVTFGTDFIYAGGSALSTSTTQLTDGTFVVIYNTDWSHIVAQKFDANGVNIGNIGGEIPINAFSNYSQPAGEVVALADGGFAVTFQTAYLDGSGYGAAIRTFDADGTARQLVDTIVNIDYTTWDQGDPQITALDNGNFIVTWGSLDQLPEDSGSSAIWLASSGVYGQLFDASGVAIGGAGSNFQINTTQPDLQYRVRTAALAGGGFVATYTNYGPDGDSLGITARIFDAAGNGGVEFTVNQTTADMQFASNVTTLADGSFVVTWQSNLADGAGYGVFARHFAADGTAYPSGEFQVNATSTDNQIVPHIIATANGGYVIAWEGQGGQDGDASGVFAQSFDANDHPLEVAATSNDELHGGAGDDSVYGGTGDDSIWGDQGNDMLSGDTGDDEVSGGAGNDDISGGSGDDLLNGGNGVDAIAGDAGSDSLFGGLGDDQLLAGAGDDEVSGGGGQDSIDGGVNDDVLAGGTGNDTVTGGSGDDQLRGDAGKDSLFGGLGDDLLMGGAGADKLYGEDGDDALAGGANLDILFGGNGADELRGDAGDDKLFGDAGDDLLLGGAGNDSVSGGLGDDVLQGGAGLDRLIGGAGVDTMTGGSGADVFIFTNGIQANGDYVLDFVHGLDKIDVSVIDANGSGSGTPDFTSLLFNSGFAANTAGTMSYDTTTGLLSFNIDNDTASEFSIHLQGAPMLTMTDFIL